MKKSILALCAGLLLTACQTTASQNSSSYTPDTLNAMQPKAGFEDMTKWHTILRSDTTVPATYTASSTKSLLKKVNTVVNNVEYKSDKKNYGNSDYWARPSEFFSRGGDCEDYAIAKYFTLEASGIDANTMKLLTVFDTTMGVYHTVLIVEVDNVNYVLDNQSNVVQDFKNLTYYKPIFLLNKNGVWSH